ncbi:MAG: PAS domain-containing protein, partial [Deltaproteobacteria bacterium]|nr:PAS domain-containing protein [Deltaproteobacteria bacterium]
MLQIEPLAKVGRASRLGFAVPAVSALFLGLLVIFGWLTGNRRIIQIGPEFAGMHFTTAVCFVLTAASLLLGASGRARASAAWLGALSGSIGAATLLAYLTPLPCSPDLLCAGLLPAFDLPYPTRMAPLTAGCFAIAGLASASEVLGGRRCDEFAAYAGGLLFAAGGTALAGYALGLRGLYGWEPFTPMAVNTALGFLFLGTALTLRPSTRVHFESWIPGWMAIAGSTASFLLWQALVQREHGQGFPDGVLDLGVLLLGLTFSLLAGLSARLAYQSHGFSRELEARVRERTAELRASEELLNHAQAIAHLGSWELDLTRDRLTWSDEVFRIFGFDPHTFRATYGAFLEAVHPEDRPAVDDAYSASLRDERQTYEIEHRIVRKSDGEIRVIHEKCRHFRDDAGRIVRSVGMVHDITERKRAEEELGRAKRAAEAANGTKSEFLARMSHELRTPLNGVIGMIDLSLLEDMTAQARQWLEISKESAWSLARIVDEILEFASLEAGKVTLAEEEFALGKVLETVVSAQRPSALNRGLRLILELSPEVPARVLGDPARLQQVLSNLVSNAVKFTETGEVAVTVDVAHDREQPASDVVRGTRNSVHLSFAVRDSGIGIPAERMPRIFERFSEATAATHAKYGGSGLGLSIAKELAELMGGRISAESTPGVGSTFRFEVELGSAKEAASRVSAALGERTKLLAECPLRILLADDDAVSRLFARELLSRLGHEAVAVSDGDEALRSLSRERFDLALMDIQMPVLDGLAATERIRAGL